MNKASSRSHAIFSVILKQQTIDDDDSNPSSSPVILDYDNISHSKRLVSKFHFVDLAGSERVSKFEPVSSKIRITPLK
jgi:hypothetical protein